MEALRPILGDTVLETFLETLRNLGPARLALMLATLFGLIIFFIFIAVRSSSPSMTLLYGDLSTADSTAIAAKLDLADVPYRLSENGDEVMVPHKDVGKARMLLAEEGLPSGGTLGYEIFDQEQPIGGNTSFRQNINQLRALEGELARTISTLSPIKNARVHLVLPQRELFSRESQPASASVFVSLRNAQLLSPDQILGMQHLIASAVPQLQPNSVTIIDSNGRMLASGTGEPEDTAVVSQRAIDMKRKYEKQMTSEIEDMIGRIVGYGKVRATVTADLDFDVITRNTESYDPESQVARSVQSISEESVENTAGGENAVTVQNNLPGLPPGGGAGDITGSQTTRTEEISNFEISRTVESIVSESGDVQKLSVAVLVDGHYETPATADGEEEAERVYTPRTQEELDQIERLVKSAIGFDETRGDTIEVANMQFAEIEGFVDAIGTEDLMFGFQKSDVISMAETLTLSIVAILIILLVLRPLVSHIATAAQQTATEGGMTDEQALLAAGVPHAQLAPPVEGGEGGEGDDESIDISQVEGRVKASTIQKVTELVDSHPNETVSVIRNWMSQES